MKQCIPASKRKPSRHQKGTLAWIFEQRGLESEFVQQCKSGANNRKLRVWCIGKGIPEHKIPESFRYTMAIYECKRPWGGWRGNGAVKLKA